MWLYPPDKDGNSLMAHPATNQKDYKALKAGILRDLFDESDEKKNERKNKLEVLDKEIFVSDEELKNYVDDVFAEQYRNSSYRILVRAKNDAKAQKAYFNFINAYHKDQKGERFGNICCLSVELAEKLLKSHIKPKKQRHKRKW